MILELALAEAEIVEASRQANENLIDTLMVSVTKSGTDAVAKIYATAIRRHVKTGIIPLLTPDEVKAIQMVMRNTLEKTYKLGWFATAHQSSGVRVQEANTSPIDLTELSPQAAIDYFLGLVPGNVNIPEFDDRLNRITFSMFVTTSNQILTSVQKAIGEFLKTGEGAEQSGGSRDRINDILDAAGVQPLHPQYVEMVFRTNTMDSFNRGAWDEFTEGETGDLFPVWEYQAIDDSRSRLWHAEKDGRVYPKSIPFHVVRGTTFKNVCNCRCTFRPVSEMEWSRMRARGKELSYE